MWDSIKLLWERINGYFNFEMPVSSSEDQALYRNPNEDLLDCLLYLSRYYERPISEAAIASGLPLVDRKLTLELVSKAASRIFVSATPQETPAEEIFDNPFPFIVMLGDKAGVVLGLKKDKISIILPSEGSEPQTLLKEEIERDYSGVVIELKLLPVEHQDIKGSMVIFKKHWFWGSLWHFWPLYRQAIFASVLINMFTLAGTVFTLTVYDRVIPYSSYSTLWVLAIGIGVIFLFDFILRNLRGYFVDTAGKNADIMISSMLFDKLMGIRMDKRPPSAGALVNEMREFESLREFLSSATLLALVDMPFLFIFLIAIFFIGGWVVVVPLIMIPLVVTITMLLQRPLQVNTKLNMKQMGVRHSLLIEAVQGVETIKGLGAEGKLQRQWEAFLQENAETGQKSKLLSAKAINFALLAQNFNNMCMVILGAYQIGAHALTMGGLIACVILAGRAMTPISQAVGLLTRLNQSKAALVKLNQLVSLPVDRPKGHQFLSKPHIIGSVEFKDVTFSYPGDENPVLDKISFSVKAGEKVALVGRIGSGKSTIEKLIMGFYPPHEGSVLIDGIDARQMDPVDVRSNISYIPQDIFLFQGTLRDNIAMGAPHLQDEDILKAAVMVGAHDFIRKHPHGYGLRLGEGGSGLSGGQRQTIACARALTSNASIFLFDEPTAQMDSAAEINFINQLKLHVHGKTLILITHRPALLALVDRIIVIDRGQVISDGPKDKVLQAFAQGQMHQGGEKA